MYSCKEAGKEDSLTILLGQFSNEIIFQKIMLAEQPVKSGLRSYGGLRNRGNVIDSLMFGREYKKK